MTSSHVKTTQLPSFSIILETENLATSDVKGLVEAITSLANQDLSPVHANEVFLIDSSDTPIDLLTQLRNQYSWLTIHQASPETEYYQAKMLGAKLVTGDVVVYYDCDCIYETKGLRMLLAPFIDPGIQIVAGETITRGVGAYATGMNLVYIFPQYSNQTTLFPVKQYFLNHVAFRRDFLLQHPIPADLPLYRGNCVIHAHTLRSQGYIIWQQPQARATHAPPQGFTFFCWRFLLIGHDFYWQQHFLNQPHPQSSWSATLISAMGDRIPIAGRDHPWQVFTDRICKMLTHEPRHLWYVPLALPVVIMSILLIAIGYGITVLQPHYLLDKYKKTTRKFAADLS
jgi:glycosyltransferase involved in cell wall biosynthesis